MPSLPTGLLLLQEGDERGDICEVDNCTAINVCFGLENTGLQNCNERSNI